jgi:hypothetical protein
MIKQPHYIGLEDARQLLAQMGVQLTLRQMQRAAEQDAQGRRKLPFFVDPIERKLKIEKDDLISVERHEGPNLGGFVYPGEHGGHQSSMAISPSAVGAPL